jgi:PAS domain S-box-containing protein
MQEALEMLRAREVTAVFGHSLALRTARAYRDGPPLDEHQLDAAPIVLATRVGREDLQPLFTSAYLRLQKSGELDAIIERALMEDAPRSEDDQVGILMLGILGIGAVALVAMLVWSRSLRREGRRRTEELLRASEHQKVQAHVLSQVADAIVVTDVQGLVTSWNAGAEAIFGRRAAEAVGQPVASLITNRMAGRRGGDLHAALSGATNWRGDAEIVRPSGDTVIVEATLRSLTDEHGQPSGTLIVAHDVNARRLAELDAGIRARQQAAIASLGQRALAGIDFRWLIDQAMSMSASILQVPVVAAFELDRYRQVMRAGEGWDSAHPDGFDMRADRACYPGVALAAHGGVACIERGDDSPPVDALHMREGIIAGVAVVIPGRSGPYGLLLVGDRRLRQFSRDDIHFLQAIANVIGAAFERSVIDADLRAELAMHHATLEAAADGILVTDTAGRARRYNQRLV